MLVESMKGDSMGSDWKLFLINCENRLRVRVCLVRVFKNSF